MNHCRCYIKFSFCLGQIQGQDQGQEIEKGQRTEAVNPSKYKSARDLQSDQSNFMWQTWKFINFAGKYCL